MTTALKGKSQTVLAKIWSTFSDDRKKNRATAYVHLQQSLARHHDDIVPNFATEKEFLDLITKTEEHTSADQQSDSGDPIEIMSSWLRGDTDLSRVHLEPSWAPPPEDSPEGEEAA